MPRTRLRIWCNQILSRDAFDMLRAAVRDRGDELIAPRDAQVWNLGVAEPDQEARDSDIAFGQPNPDDVIGSERLKWIHLSTAGYTRYDQDDVRAALRSRGAVMTTSSSVYADPCAQHVLAMMLSISRQLPQSLLEQQQHRWDYLHLRDAMNVLTGQSALIVGYGAIGRRLAELLRPFEMSLIALRRRVRGDEGIETRTMEQIGEVLGDADHVIDLLPASTTTERFFTREQFARMKPTARFYNVGRGDTVDQPALIEALRGGKVGAAYLDVTTPEPLPPDDPLWSAPNCFITPHTAGGHQHEHRRLVEHFLNNLMRLKEGREMQDRIV